MPESQASTPQTFDQVLQETIAEASAPPPAETVAAPAEQAEGTDDAFSSVDPKTLPPELKAIYKSLQADYTKKTQALATERKSADANKQLFEAWKPAMEVYARDPNVRAKVDAAYARAEAAADAAGVNTANVDEFSEFLQDYDAKDHAALKKLAATIESSVSKKHSSEIAALKRELEERGSQIQSVARDQVERDAAVEAKRFERKYPDWKEALTPRQQRLFVIELQENPDKPVESVYEELLTEFGAPARAAEDETIKKLESRARQRVLRNDAPGAKSQAKISEMRDAWDDALREHRAA